MRDSSSDWTAAGTAKVHFVIHVVAPLFDFLDNVSLAFFPRGMNIRDRLDRQKIIVGTGEQLTCEFSQIFSRHFAPHRRKLSDPGGAIGTAHDNRAEGRVDLFARGTESDRMHQEGHEIPGLGPGPNNSLP